MQPITAAELAASLQQGVALELVDARPRDERSGGYIEGSRELGAGLDAELLHSGRGTPLVVVCRHGRQARRIASYLARRGFVDVYELVGGMDAWVSYMRTRVRALRVAGAGEEGLWLSGACPCVSVLLLPGGSGEEVAAAVRSVSWQQLPWPWSLDVLAGVRTADAYEAAASVANARVRVLQFGGGTSLEAMRSALLRESHGELLASIGEGVYPWCGAVWALMDGVAGFSEESIVAGPLLEQGRMVRSGCMRRFWGEGPVLAARQVMVALDGVAQGELLVAARSLGCRIGRVHDAQAYRAPIVGAAPCLSESAPEGTACGIVRMCRYTASGVRLEAAGPDAASPDEPVDPGTASRDYLAMRMTAARALIRKARVGVVRVHDEQASTLDCGCRSS